MTYETGKQRKLDVMLDFLDGIKTLENFCTNRLF